MGDEPRPTLEQVQEQQLLPARILRVAATATAISEHGPAAGGWDGK